MTFNPKEHLTQLRGSEYLEVKWRLVWFRDEHPDWTIETEPLVLDTERQVAVFHATVKDAEGRILSQGTKMENAKGFPDYLEKAETGAVGRALAMCGYGTQFAPEFDEGEHRVDAPVTLPPFENRTVEAGKGRNGKGAVSEPAPPSAAAPHEAALCAACGKPVKPTPKYTVEKLIEVSMKRYGEPYCYECAVEAARREGERER